jgi:hypothetical protein
MNNISVEKNISKGGMEMRKISVLSAVLAGVVLAACGPAAPVVEAGVGYGLVHGHYVGVAEIETEDDVVTAITIEEYFLPYNWAKVSEADATANPNDTVSRTWKRSPTATTNVVDFYAKYITIGDRLFTATITGDVPNQTLVYSATGISDLEVWVETETNAQWYVEQINDEAFALATSAGVDHPSLVRSDATSNVAMTKSESGYWTVVAPGLGWSGNIAAIETLLVGTSMDFTPEDFTKNTNGFWANGDLVSGATLTDFQDYIALALRAYANRAVVEAA